MHVIYKEGDKHILKVYEWGASPRPSRLPDGRLNSTPEPGSPVQPASLSGPSVGNHSEMGWGPSTERSHTCISPQHCLLAQLSGSTQLSPALPLLAQPYHHPFHQAPGRPWPPRPAPEAPTSHSPCGAPQHHFPKLIISHPVSHPAVDASTLRG